MSEERPAYGREKENDMVQIILDELNEWGLSAIEYDDYLKTKLAEAIASRLGDLEKRQSTAEELAEVLQEARLQLEYLNEKFGKTGTGNTAISRITAALEQFKTLTDGK